MLIIIQQKLCTQPKVPQAKITARWPRMINFASNKIILKESTNFEGLTLIGRKGVRGSDAHEKNGPRTRVHKENIGGDVTRPTRSKIN